MLASAVLFTLAAAPFAPAAHADCPTPGSVDPVLIPDLFHPTHPGQSSWTCANLGPAGGVTAGTLFSVRVFDPNYGTGAGGSAFVCHTGVGCTNVPHTGAGWHAPTGDIVSVGANGARVDAGSVTVWPANWTGRNVDLCVTTNATAYPC